MHDIHEPSVQAAIKMIPELVAKGYKLMTVSELAAAKGVTLQNANYSDFWDSSLQKGIVAGYNSGSSDGSSDGTALSLIHISFFQRNKELSEQRSERPGSQEGRW